MTPIRIRNPLFAVALLGMLACSAPDRTPTGVTLEEEQSGRLNPSGFLSDYSKLSPSKIPDMKGAYVFKTKKSWTPYKLVILEPVKVHLRPGAAGRKQSPAELQNLAKYFESRLNAALGDSFPVVDSPGFGVMRIRAALVDATPNMPLSKGFSATPVVGTTGVELEILDSVTGEQLAAAVDSRPGKWYKLKNLTENDGYAKELLNQWAALLRNGLDDARGLHRASDFGKSATWAFN